MQSILTHNVKVNRAEIHLYFAVGLPFIELLAHFIFVLRFSPNAPSPGWAFLGLLGLELLEDHLAHILASFLVKGLYLDMQCTYLKAKWRCRS